MTSQTKYCECEKPSAAVVPEGDRVICACNTCGLPIRPSVEPKSRAELIEEMKKEMEIYFERYNLPAKVRLMIWGATRQALLRISDASMDAVEVEKETIVGQIKASEQQKDILRKVLDVARTASQEKRTLFVK